MLRELSGEPDAAVLLQLGRCYLASGETPAAEDCFLSAIQVDPDSIEPRIELANMYEKAKEAEEALILAAEAMALRGARRGGGDSHDSHGDLDYRARRRPQARRRSAARGGDGSTSTRDAHAQRPVVPRRYRPKRLGAPDQRRREEQAHAVKLSRQYETVRDLKQQIQNGRDDLMDTWLQSSQELVDDFRSLKQFYSWDKYLKFLRSKSSFQEPAQGLPENELFQMYERLTRSKWGNSSRWRNTLLI